MKEQEHDLKHLTKCPLCKAKYSHSQASVLEENEARTVFHLTCSKCNSAVIAFVSDSQQGIVSLGVATDLTGQEAGKFLKSNTIEPEEVLNVYEYLNN
jgi:hypothetical protein